jgi:hypothetical protein
MRSCKLHESRVHIPSVLCSSLSTLDFVLWILCLYFIRISSAVLCTNCTHCTQCTPHNGIITSSRNQDKNTKDLSTRSPSRSAQQAYKISPPPSGHKNIQNSAYTISLFRPMLVPPSRGVGTVVCSPHPSLATLPWHDPEAALIWRGQYAPR